MKLVSTVPGLPLLWALLLAATLAMAQDRATLEQRWQSVGTLINGSSAARQIDGSGVVAARERRDNARLLHREAGALIGGGDLAAAARTLDQATREMMEGARLARPEQVTAEKQQRDFDARLESTRALLAAQQRITREKGGNREAEAAARGIETELQAAQALAAQAQLTEARTRLDRAYLTARVSIESLRRGDTLVRSLTFASPREEYDYEVDRNDTHGMLIKVLLAERKDASGALPPQMRPFVDRAGELRREAEGLARGGDHGGAVKALEASTRELVRAIRAGGIYIPG